MLIGESRQRRGALIRTVDSALQRYLPDGAVSITRVGWSHIAIKAPLVRASSAGFRQFGRFERSGSDVATERPVASGVAIAEGDVKRSSGGGD